MANTYTQIYIQVVFAVQGRQNVIRPERKEELHKYLTGVVTRQGQKLIAIHCMPDHTHVLIGLKPNLALSDLVGDIKTGSTKHINENRWMVGRFCWQQGFGAFSYGHSQLKGVIEYIRDQVRHHARKSFRQEYLQFLKKFEIHHDVHLQTAGREVACENACAFQRGASFVRSAMFIASVRPK